MGSSGKSAGKMEGLRVVDLSNFIPGPLLSLVLADHGAEVFKIETPGEGDPTRQIGVKEGNMSLYFRNLNRGKKSLALNLKDDSDRAALLNLCETADVFIESFRPGVAERLGVSYDRVRARNPRIVYCSISAYGQTGPYKDMAAHDIALEGVAGLLSMTLDDDGRPVMPGAPLGDLSSAFYGLSGVLMALLAREKTGEGDYLDISMHDTLLASMLNTIGPAQAERRQPDVKNERITGGAALYRIYDTADGRQLALAGSEMKFVKNLLTDLGRPDLIDLCAHGPGEMQKPVVAFLDKTFKSQSLDYWKAWLAERDVCWGPVNDVVEALDDPHLIARNSIVTDHAGRRHIASPIRFLNQPAAPTYEAPALDRDHDLVKPFKS